MKLKGIPIKGARVDKAGKLVKLTKPRDASHAIAMKRSKKQRPVRRGAI